MLDFRSRFMSLIVFASLGGMLSFYAIPPDRGTWSIVAVDRETGQIGIAGASCTFNVQGIGEVIPGVGAVVVQGMSSDEARERGMERLRAGDSTGQIVTAMRDNRFDPKNQQYAVVSLKPNQEPAVFTGSETATWTWSGSVTGDGVSVQGNSLVSEAVVEKTLATFQKTRGSLTERLVMALEAGAESGGDKRCGDQRARSAFVTVFNADDPASTPYFHLVVYGTEKGGEPAVEHLLAEFKRLYPHSKNRQSTRVYVIPAKSDEGNTLK